MCLAIPATVIACDHENSMATVNIAGEQQEVSTALLDHVDTGDYLLIHTGFALYKLSEAEAKSTLALFADMKTMHEQDQQRCV